MSEYPFIHLLPTPARPKKLRTSETDLGISQSNTFCTVDGWIIHLSSDTMVPTMRNRLAAKIALRPDTVIPASIIAPKTKSRF